MPEQDTVLAITGGVEDMQAVLSLVWEILLPELQASPLPANIETQKALEKKLSTLQLLPPHGQASSPAAGQVSGKEYRIEANDMKIESVSFEFSNEGCKFNICGTSDSETPAVLDLGVVIGLHQIVCGNGVWREGALELFGRGKQIVYASGIWTAEDTYAATVRMVNTPFCFNFICRFSDEEVELKMVQNVSLGPKEAPVLFYETSGRYAGKSHWIIKVDRSAGLLPPFCSWSIIQVNSISNSLIALISR
jgi:hypothetical protein